MKNVKETSEIVVLVLVYTMKTVLVVDSLHCFVFLLHHLRCDSPGYSAKYCHYTMMLDDTGEILQTDLVQVI